MKKLTPEECIEEIRKLLKYENIRTITEKQRKKTDNNQYQSYGDYLVEIYNSMDNYSLEEIAHLINKPTMTVCREIHNAGYKLKYIRVHNTEPKRYYIPTGKDIADIANNHNLTIACRLFNIERRTATAKLKNHGYERRYVK